MGFSDNPDPVDVVTVGETMIAFVGRFEERSYAPVLAGAESNVAVGLAALGHRARWVSRLGADRLGRSIADELVERGVDVDVVWVDDHPTGVMVKHVGGSHPDRVYYRRDSAASRLPSVDLDRLGPAAWTHVTGLTPALSASAHAMVSALFGGDRGGRVSFDVNLRPVLWNDLAEAAPVTRSSRTTVAALPVPVVDVVGAGDAFAAGFLAGCCRGWPTDACLRLGHLLAARVIAVVEDVVPPLDPTEVARLTPEHLAALWDDHD